MSPPRPIPDVSPTSAFRRWPGREEWHGHQLGAADLPSAQLSAAAGEAKADWWIIARVGGRWGIARRLHGSIRMTSSASMRRCPVSKTTASGRLISARWRISAVRRGTPCRRCAGRSAAARPPDITRGWHGDGRLRMVPVTPQPTRATTDAFYPLILNSGRIRDQWHTMTRTGAVPRLMQHIAEPMVEVAPQDAVRYQLPADGLARIWSRHGVMVAKVAISEGQRPARCLFRCTGTTSLPVRGG